MRNYVVWGIVLVLVVTCIIVVGGVSHYGSVAGFLGGYIAIEKYDPFAAEKRQMRMETEIITNRDGLRIEVGCE
jgi:membrane associated rhomboid family serine protease